MLFRLCEQNVNLLIFYFDYGIVLNLNKYMNTQTLMMDSISRYLMRMNNENNLNE